MMPMSPKTIDRPRATRMRMQPFTRPMNSCAYQTSSGKPKRVRSAGPSDLLTQGLLRVEAFTLARFGGRIAAHALHDVEEVPRVLHRAGRLALAEVDLLDVDVVAGPDLFGALEVLELPPLEGAGDLVGLERLDLVRGLEQQAHRGIGRRGVAGGGALAERKVPVVVALGRRELVLQVPVPRHPGVGVVVDARAGGLRERELGDGVDDPRRSVPATSSPSCPRWPRPRPAASSSH